MTQAANPFPAGDPDRRYLWDMLVERDIEAFVASEWSLVERDFVAAGFQAIDARLGDRPDSWRLKYPTLDAYRDDWLSQSRATMSRADAEAVRSGLHATTTLRDIEIAGESALAHKKFDGKIRLRDGTTEVLRWQTLYYCRKVGDEWKITGFVGYLPNPMGSDAETTGERRGAPKRLPPGATQHLTAGPYSPVLEVAAADLVVISGQAALAHDGSVVGDDVSAQARTTLENCAARLASAGCSFADVFKVNVYLTDLGDWAAFNEVYAELMPDPKPVRTAVQAGLLPGLLVEVEMSAVKASR
ncbi:MAG TPA: RidA family protein [Trueperaceae bacterium]|nr:RidA family protein [Trueperaceae bacterium]